MPIEYEYRVAKYEYGGEPILNCCFSSCLLITIADVQIARIGNETGKLHLSSGQNVSGGLDEFASRELKPKLKRIASMLTRMAMKFDGVRESSVYDAVRR